MAFWELMLVALALSMDAFAAAVCQGLTIGRRELGHALLTGLFFGGFQALMPLLGYLLSVWFRSYIAVVDHWIAFALLAGIGIHMIRGAKDECGVAAPGFKLREMLLLSVATSIDALAVGVTFAFLHVSVGPAVGVIGATTFILSFIGVSIGNLFGARFKKRAQVAGGGVLVVMGVKILAEHLLQGQG